MQLECNYYSISEQFYPYRYFFLVQFVSVRSSVRLDLTCPGRNFRKLTFLILLGVVVNLDDTECRAEELFLYPKMCGET